MRSVYACDVISESNSVSRRSRIPGPNFSSPSEVRRRVCRRLVREREEGGLALLP
jgi:hypothetical protein